MSQIIGTGDAYSTWGSLRGLLFQNGVSGITFTPPGFYYSYHNRVFPPTSGEYGYAPAYFAPESGTLLRTLEYGGSGYIDWVQYYEPGPNQSYWTGTIMIYMDHKDFQYMIGKTVSAPNASTTIQASAEVYPGQLLDTEQDWWPGFTSVEKFKLVT